MDPCGLALFIRHRLGNGSNLFFGGIDSRLSGFEVLSSLKESHTVFSLYASRLPHANKYLSPGIYELLLIARHCKGNFKSTASLDIGYILFWMSDS